LCLSSETGAIVNGSQFLRLCSQYLLPKSSSVYKQQFILRSLYNTTIPQGMTHNPSNTRFFPQARSSSVNFQWTSASTYIDRVLPAKRDKAICSYCKMLEHNATPTFTSTFHQYKETSRDQNYENIRFISEQKLHYYRFYYVKVIRSNVSRCLILSKQKNRVRYLSKKKVKLFL
jgi:hypothetical protein